MEGNLSKFSLPLCQFLSLFIQFFRRISFSPMCVLLSFLNCYTASAEMCWWSLGPRVQIDIDNSAQPQHINISWIQQADPFHIQWAGQRAAVPSVESKKKPQKTKTTRKQAKVEVVTKYMLPWNLEVNTQFKRLHICMTTCIISSVTSIFSEIEGLGS